MQDLEHLKEHLKGKVVILGIGNTLRSDDGVGSLLATRIKDAVHYTVYDAGSSPENYLGKIVKDNPETVVLIDAVDYGGKPGEFRVVEPGDIQTVNFFSTHNASISLAINYLKSKIQADIIILIIQPKSVVFGESLSPEIDGTLNSLEGWFREQGQIKG
jgi:hydrogenase 3 maturation protease